jgi:hypothetical protein
MSNGDDDYYQQSVFEAAKDSPVADAVAPVSFFIAAKRLPELGGV